MSLFAELRRRNVFRVTIAYVITAWLVMQVADVVINNIGAPGWLFRAILLVLGIGFFLAVFFAWAFELTPEGIKREKDVDPNQSITGQTGRKLDRAIIVLLVLVAGYFIWEARFAGKGISPDSPGTAPDSIEAVTEQPAKPAAASEDNSIAVLPFANRSRLEDDLFFTDGIHDDLLTQLAKINGLKVISRTSVMEYRNTTKKIAEIADELGVGRILEGGVQRAGDRIRINAQLIDVSSDEHLWAETFDREMTLDNLFDIQSEITQQIVTAIRGELSAQELDSISERPTHSLPAWEAYLKAKAATLRPDYTKEKYIEAQDWAQRAVNIDPEFAEAWALLAEVHGQAVWIGWDNTPQRRADAKLAMERAVALKPESAAVMNARADYYYRIENDYARALPIIQEASARAPGDARLLFYLGVTQRRTGQLEAAAESMRRAVELDPANLFTVTQLADTYQWLRDWDALDRLTDQWLDDAPEARDLRTIQIRALIEGHGDLVKARQKFNELHPWVGNFYASLSYDLPLLERDLQRTLEATRRPEFIEHTTKGSPEDDGYILLARGEAHCLLGECDSATPLLRQAIEKLEVVRETGPVGRAFDLSAVATAQAYLGDGDQAFALSAEATETLPRSRDYLFGSAIANTHTWLMAYTGRRDAALERLRETLDRPTGFTRHQLALDPRWDFFRDDERFNVLANPGGNR